jgi:hypothetical protein
MAETAAWISSRRDALTKPALHQVTFPEREADVLSLLDATQQSFLDYNGDHRQIGLALDRLFGEINQHRLTSLAEDWQRLIQICRLHPVLGMLHEDPFTHRAFAKPRGYAGDAQLIDLIYGPEDRAPEPVASALGLDIYRYTTSAPAAEGVRARRGFIADLIDATAVEGSRRHILAIAAGHLREANLTTAVRRQRVGRFVALDSDPVSLQEVDRSYGTYGVETVPASFRVLITNRLQIGTFDLVYSTGLFDYLNQNTGRRLVTTMFEMLNPGGQLVVANFLPGIRDIGYMEAFMDWKLIYRTRQEMVDLTAEINESDINHLALFAEENRNIIFLHITKK